MVEQINDAITQQIKDENDKQASVHNIESELSKYSLNESDINHFLEQQKDNSTQNDQSSVTSLSSSSIESLPSTNTASSHRNETLIKELNNGLIHGHIHNFQNFTYIHGHIHTNDTPQLTPASSSNIQQPLLTQPSPSSTKRKSRRSSSHRHFNEPEASQFSDCQHFEFLNCHDKNSILNSDIQCSEDHENCIPKLVEICCDDKHDAQNNLMPNFPSCTDHEQTDENKAVACDNDDTPVANTTATTNAATATVGNDKLDLNSRLDDCIDIKCDLDTCNIDELYCKYCEDIDQITNEFTPGADTIKNDQVKIEKNEQNQAHHSILDMLNNNSDIVSDYHNQTGANTTSTAATTTKNDAPVHFTDPMNCINPNCNAFKRHREDDVHNSHSLHHHLHHHSFQHSDTHHHHHIQIHDHQPKKVKKSVRTNDDFINFEWNFKNQGAKCEWENCSTTLDNSFQLQNHIVEDHLLSEYNVPPQSSNPTGSFECEWKNCDYSGYDLFSLVNHINDTHGFQYDFDINNIFKKHDQLQEQLDQQQPGAQQQPLQSLNFPTPSSDSNDNSSSNSSISNIVTTGVKKKSRSRPQLEETEETTCKWVDLDPQGQITHECNKTFHNAEALTDHLIHDHVGSGKSEYTCLWANCSRNHRNFNQRQKIIRHLHVHTRYKPFVCRICHHSFAVESMLEQHMRTHSGEKPYKCKVCDKHFATSSSLSIHVRTHTGEKPLVCKYPGCGKRFSESSNLTKHIKTHEKFFKCDCCSKSFSKEKQLQSHMAKYHPV